MVGRATATLTTIRETRHSRIEALYSSGAGRPYSILQLILLPPGVPIELVMTETRAFCIGRRSGLKLQIQLIGLSSRKLESGPMNHRGQAGGFLSRSALLF